MKCIACGGATMVTNTYQNENGSTRRRRECAECEFRFTTRERAEVRGEELEEQWNKSTMVERFERLRNRRELED